MAARLRDDLGDAVGSRNVFIDVDSLQAGQDFRQVIVIAIEECTALLTLIGPRWELLEDERGAVRLRKADDLVRLELETAIRQRIGIVPVLVERATMPKPGDLPRSIRPLCDRHAVQLRHLTFRADVVKLLEAIVGEPDDDAPTDPRLDVELVSRELFARRFRLTIDGSPHTLEWRQRIAAPDVVLLDGVVVARTFAEVGYRRDYRFTPPLPNAPALAIKVRKRLFGRGLGGCSISTHDRILYSEGTV